MLKKVMVSLVLILVFFLSAAYASLLTSSEIIGPRHFVFQAGYGSSNFGSQAANNRGGAELKIGCGLVYPWDILLRGGVGNYPAVAGQTFQAIGADLRYGVMKNLFGEKTPADISIVMGVEGSRTLQDNIAAADETSYHLAAIIGRSFRRPVAYATPYLGGQISSAHSSGNWLRTDHEIVLGFKYGLNAALSLIIEGSYHWVKSSTSLVNNTEVGAGVAWKI